MSFLVGTLFLASMSFVEPGSSDPAGLIERIVVVLGEDDPVISARVLRQLKACTDRTPTAIVSFLEGLRVERDFTNDSDALFAAISRAASTHRQPSGTEAGAFDLAARLPPEAMGRPRSLVASLRPLAEALAPVGPTTVLVLLSPHIGAEPASSVEPPTSEGEQGATTGNGFATVAVQWPVYEARRALRRARLTVVAVITDGQFDAGVKALTEVPGGRYLRFSQKRFKEQFLSAVCAPRR